jgi:steroid 5-alpha reductase family enzyme
MDRVLYSFVNFFHNHEDLLKDNLQPLTITTYVCLLSSSLCWIGQILTGNLSFVDRIWPIMPMIYSWIFTLYPVFNGEGEDYRWVFVRKMIPKSLFQIFNFVFIAFIQNFLLLGFTLPAYVMFLNRSKPFSFYDLIFVILFELFYMIEVIADQQQWHFQTQKYKLIDEKRIDDKPEYKKGFITSGLFKYSRHPNFFAEIMIWWSFYLISVTCSGEILNFSIFGALFLTLLFQGSTTLTEYITKSKYAVYEEYQKKVNRLTPWFSNWKSQ